MEKHCIIKSDDIDNFIINKMEQYPLPGLSASIVIDDTVIWQNAYGYANIIDNVNVTNDTLFKIASVSNTITASALMQLYAGTQLIVTSQVPYSFAALPGLAGLQSSITLSARSTMRNE